MLPPWVILQTKSMAEEVAEHSLRQAGYRVYLPRFRKLLIPHGRERRTVSAMRPLFPRVIFVQDWRGFPVASPVSGTVGVMMLRPGVPARLADKDIALIIERERAGDFDEVKQPRGSDPVRSDIAPGDEVEFEAFGARVLGVLEQLTPDGKATVAAMLFGGQVPAEIDAEALRRRSLS